MAKIIVYGKNFYNNIALNNFNIDFEYVEKLRKLVTTKTLFGHAVPFSRAYKVDWYENIFDTSIPNWQLYSTISFEEATEQRSQELIQVYENEDIPIVVNWSGGIDSTLILASIHKNFPDYLKKRVIVSMNNTSFCENPYFYNKIIKPHYKVSFIDTHNYIDNFMLHGDPADAFWIQGGVINLSSKLNVSEDDVNSNPENFVNFYKSKGFTIDESLWYLNFYIDTAKDYNIQLKTTLDLLWWSNFSCHLNFSVTKLLTKIDRKLLIPQTNYIDIYKKHAIPWYLSNAYQVWSIQSQLNGSKFDGSVRNYKMEAKEYIYNVDKNLYYRDYKTKVQSLTPHSNSTESFSDSVIDNTGKFIRNI